MAEEATNANPWSPDTRILGLISRAAFDVDDYWRIVDILHNKYVLFLFTIILITFMIIKYLLNQSSLLTQCLNSYDLNVF